MPRSVPVGLAVALLVLAAGCGSSGGRSSSGSKGSEIVLQALVRGPVTAANLDGAAEIMKQRLAKLGVDGEVTHPVMTKRIVVRLDGVSPEAAKAIADTVASSGRLAFYDVEDSLVPPSRDPSAHPVAFRSL